MANRKLVRVLNHILTTASDDCGVSDAELLQRFTGNGDAAAFELLVWRYQRLVFGICRRVLSDVHDAEDAFQTTFLILARKASSVTRQAAIGSWLHQVATRAALLVRERQSQTAARECSLEGNELAASAEDESRLERQELWSVVDEEVNRLPARLRTAVVLCYFEGKTLAEASRLLKCPQGTVASRLARARERLRVRLTGRGLAVSSGVLAAGLTQASFAGAMAEGLVCRTGQVIAGSISTKIVTLSREVLRSMFIRKITTTAAILVAGLMVMGGGLAFHLYSSPRAEAVQAANNSPKAPEEKAIPVTVGRPVQREVAPFEVFNGRLTIEYPGKRIGEHLYVVFNMDERSYLRVQRLRIAGKVKVREYPLAVGLIDETGFPHAATLESFSSAIDEKQCIINAIGIVAPNPDGLFLPGMTARVRMSFGPPRPVLEVPDEAVGRDQGETFLWVVNDRNNVARRPVRTGPMDGGMRIIEEGLKPEERIVIGGAKGLKPGDHVEP